MHMVSYSVDRLLVMVILITVEREILRIGGRV